MDIEGGKTTQRLAMQEDTKLINFDLNNLTKV